MAKDRPGDARWGKRGGESGDGRQSSGRRQPRREYPDYDVVDPSEIDHRPDVVLDIPVVKVDEICLDVDHLRATVSLRADLHHLVNVNVGVAARLGNVELKIEGVEAQGLFMARLDNVSRLLGRVLTTLDRNPALLESVGRSIENVGGGARGTLEGAGGALGALGRGGRQAIGDVGKGAGQAVDQVGQDAGEAAGRVGRRAGQAAGGVGGRGEADEQDK
jgi:hypothetical protein